ncbi:MAG: MBL fold metallo-hydrolase [Deltaproteobacteria bacterium]|nr:MBL fold metallo-hydrolase [Deltaproteobacteria bacterium]
MALTYCVLASGSSGNCLWVRGGGVQVLVDCGLSARMTGRRLEERGGRLEDVSAVVCTHGHSDHVMGARVLAKRHGLDIYATHGTASAIPGIPNERSRLLPCDGEVRLGGLTIRSVPTSHDAPQAVALRIDDGESSLGVVTDLGVATATVVEAFAGLDGLLVETNHDVRMLQEGPYPEPLKRRIRGRWGHLSNEQGAELLAALLHDGLQHVTIGHISEHNNTPDLARAAIEKLLAARGGQPPKLAVAVQHRVGEPVTLAPRASATPSLRQASRQLAFAFR